MDQSFSVDNFKKILSYENRKGRNLEKEFFPAVFETTKEISEINKKIHTQLILEIRMKRFLQNSMRKKSAK